MPVTSSVAERSGYRQIAETIYEWIKRTRKIPKVNIPVSSIDLREKHGSITGYFIDYMVVKGTAIERKYFETLGDDKEVLHVKLKKGVAILYNIKPEGGSAIVVYSE